MTNPKQNKELLGKGIRSLLQSIDADLKTGSGQLKPSVVESATGTSRIRIEDIDTNPRQPRYDFDETALNELAASIRLHDIIQPVTVSKMPSGRYRLIAGERRLRAARLAGLQDIPAYVRQANDAQLLELALLENLQRENLNPMEVSMSLQRMMEELDYTQEQVARQIGKDRSTVANFIRLLNLPPDIQLAVRKNEISFGHARAILGVNEVDKQMLLYREVRDKGLSVRQTEALVQAMNRKSPVKKAAKSHLSPGMQRIEDKLASHFGTRVKLRPSRNGGGQIHIEYYSQEEFNKILRLMQAPLD
ncbi:MAG: hypothetical protein RJA57_1300 [Bacteroidota bacterium]|jgi:ParB family chromosome partitioning protein